MAVTRANIGVKTWDLIRSEFQVDLLPSIVIPRGKTNSTLSCNIPTAIQQQ